MTRRRDPLTAMCGRLGQHGNGPVDVCKLEQGHDGPHQGKYHGLQWTDRIRRTAVPKPGSGRKNPIHSLPPQPGEERWR